MLNLSLLIYVGIWVTGIGMSAVGIEMTMNPPTDKTKWRYRATFIFMGLTFFCLEVWQYARVESESKRLAHEHQEEQLRNEGNLKYMQGQLDSQNKLLTALTANSDPKQVAQLLTGMNTKRSTLKKETLLLCSEMESWAKQYSKTHPFPNSVDPTKATAKEQEAQNTWIQTSNHEYFTRFGPRALAIVQQYGAKGVDVRMIEQQSSYGYIPGDLVPKLRAFANRLDESGNLKD
jgi:hypothetical protein